MSEHEQHQDEQHQDDEQYQDEQRSAQPGDLVTVALTGVNGAESERHALVVAVDDGDDHDGRPASLDVLVLPEPVRVSPDALRS